jgi:hypothetical protein
MPPRGHNVADPADRFLLCGQGVVRVFRWGVVDQDLNRPDSQDQDAASWVRAPALRAGPGLVQIHPPVPAMVAIVADEGHQVGAASP